MPPQLGFRTFADPPDERSDDRGPHAPADPPGLPPTTGPGRLSRRSLLLVLLFASAMLLPALGGSLRVLTVHEVFAAQTAREMFQTGDWIIPHFAGVPRTNKTPGMYWLIAGFMSVFQSRAEWVVRLPSALAGILTAVLVARLAARWLGDFAGLVAGLMQASLFYVLMQARLAEADMPMAAAVTLAMWAFAVAVVDGTATPRRRLTLAFWFGLGTGLSVLFKGVGIAFIFAGCLLWMFLNRRWRALRFVFHPASLLPMALVGFAWPIAAYLRDPAIAHELFFESFERAAGAFNDSDPWHIYFWSVPLLLLPWFPFAVRGLIQWWRTSPADILAGQANPLATDREVRRDTLARSLRLTPELAFLVCWFAAGMTILLFSQARHKHYAIPMLPPVTVLAAAGFAWWLRDANRPTVRRAAVVAGGVAAVVIVAAFALGRRVVPQAPMGAAVTIAGVAVAVAAAVVTYAARQWRATTAACFTAALVGGLGAQVLVLPAFDDYKASTALAREADRLTPAGQTIYFVLIGQSQAAYYIDHPLQRLDGRQKAFEFLRDASDRDFYILCEEGAVKELQKLGSVMRLAAADHLRRSEKDRLVFVRLSK